MTTEQKIIRAQTAANPRAYGALDILSSRRHGRPVGGNAALAASGE